MAHLIQTCFIQDQTEDRTAQRRAGMVEGTDSWHTLGKPIDFDYTMTADDITLQAGWNVKLEKRPLSYVHPITGEVTLSGHFEPSLNDGKGGYVKGRHEVIRLDNGQSIGDVGEGYELLQYDHTVDVVRPWIEQGLATPTRAAFWTVGESLSSP